MMRRHEITKRKFHGLSIIIFFFLLLPAHSADEIALSKAYWEDKGAHATFAEARAEKYEAYDGTLSKGYTQSAIWLKLRIAGQTDPEPLALIIRPAFLQRIELYDPALTPHAAPVKPIVSGRETAIEDDNHIGFENGFIIPSSRLDRDLFIRITSRTSLTADARVLRLGDAHHTSRILSATIYVYFAVLIIFCLWGLVNWSIQRDKIYGLFAVRQFYSAVHVFVSFGLLRYFFSHELSASSRETLYCLVVVTIVIIGLFDVRLLSEFGEIRVLKNIFLIVISCLIVTVPLVFLGYTGAALHINSYIVNTAMFLILLMALTAHNRAKRPYGDLAVWIIRIGFFLMTAAVSIPVLMYQNIISSSVPVLNVLFAHAVISSLILFAILSIRGRQRDIVAQQSFLQYELKVTELQRESERRAEKEQFLAMLIHELRNPLSVIRLLTDGRSSGSMAVRKAVVDMMKVLERVEQSEKIDNGGTVIQNVRFSLNDLISEIAGRSGLLDRLDVEAPADLTIVSDETLVTRIIVNLLDNAEKYSPSGSRISLKTSSDGSGLNLSISNEVGEAGVPNAELLFSKYYRSKGAHRQPGSGLGLYLVKGWAGMLGGRIAYEHNFGTNSTERVEFHLWIPQ
jgi:signal transduction histidine kinase